MSLTKVTFAMVDGAQVNVFDFGAVGDGVADDTAAIQAALNTGNSVYLPKGVYKITDALNITVQGTAISGANIVATTIIQHTLDEKIFNVTANDTSISKMTLDYSSTVLTGATAIDCSGANPNYFDFKINKCDIGLKLVGSIIGFFSDFKIYNYARAGVYVEDCGDQLFNNFLIDAINSTNGSLGGIFLNKFAEAICFVSGDILNGVYSLQTTSDSTSAGQVPAHNSFTNVYFDSSAQGSYLDKCFTTEFVSCWFSAGRSGAGFAGVELRTCESVTFIGTRFVNCGAHGCIVSNLASRTTFSACTFLGNSVTTGADVSSGLKINATTTNVTVTSCTFRNTYFVGTQKYGIEISNGCGSLIISDNNLQGNATAGIAIFGAITNSKIVNNLGYNPVGGASITVGASPFTHTSGATPETVYINGGTVSLIVTQGVAVFSSTDKTIQLGPFESVQVTYSSTPNMLKVIH